MEIRVTSAPWLRPVAALIAVATMLSYAFLMSRRVPLLGWADLGFHELGHMLTRPFGETISFIMGSGTQVLVPLSLAAYFWWKRHDAVASGLMLGWGATSLQDASVYIADAPYERLQLIGGDHDWAHLFHTWDKMNRAEATADVVWLLGLIAGITAVAVCAWPLIDHTIAARRAQRRRQLAATLPVRSARKATTARGDAD